MIDSCLKAGLPFHPSFLYCMSLPPLKEACSSHSALELALSTLLEPSKSLREHLVPSLWSTLLKTSNPPANYTALVDQSEYEVETWGRDEKADFLGGHPRIGEVKGLSAFSSKEQSGKAPTPPEVLAKLEVKYSI